MFLFNYYDYKCLYNEIWVLKIMNNNNHYFLLEQYDCDRNVALINTIDSI